MTKSLPQQTEPTFIPAATFEVGNLLDRDRWKDGPLVVYWNQDRWIEPNRELTACPLPPRKLRYRLARLKPYLIRIRLAPPKGEDLDAWGEALAGRLAISHTGGAKPEDSAVWLPAAVWAKDAAGALGSAGLVLKSLAGVDVSAVAVKVEKAA